MIETDPAAILQQIADGYLAYPQSRALQEELDRWQPSRSIWSLMQRMTRLLPRFRQRWAMVAGHRLAFLEIGAPDRPTVVLLHGFGASKESWLSLALGLAGGYHLLIPDVPGFGESSYLPRARYTYPQQAQRLAQWYGDLNLQPANWVGSSMGGAIAAVVAANFPENVASLTLMNAAGIAGLGRSPMEIGLLEGKNVLIPSNYSEVAHLFRMTTHRNQSLWARIMPPLMAKDMVQRAAVKRRLFQEMLQPEVPTSSLLPKISMPTLVVWGDQDRILDVCCADIFKSLIPHAQVKVFKNIGHLPMLEAPRLTARALNRFWRAV